MKFTYLRNVCMYDLHYLQRYNKVLILFNIISLKFIYV